MGGPDRTVDEKIARIASANQGGGARQRLPAGGASRRGIERRLRRASLPAVFPGDYRVGHPPPSRDAHYLAAVRACGTQAALYGPAAAHLLALIKGDAPRPHVM